MAKIKKLEEKSIERIRLSTVKFVESSKELSLSEFMTAVHLVVDVYCTNKGYDSCDVIKQILEGVETEYGKGQN